MCYVLKCYRSFSTYADSSNVWDLEAFTASHESVTSLSENNQKTESEILHKNWRLNCVMVQIDWGLYFMDGIFQKCARRVWLVIGRSSGAKPKPLLSSHVSGIWCLLDRASLWYLKNKKRIRCHLLYLLYFLDTQHVSGINMSIFRSLRLCCWTTTLTVLFLDFCVLE